MMHASFNNCGSSLYPPLPLKFGHECSRLRDTTRTRGGKLLEIFNEKLNIAEDPNF
jgi:hypothetical protein